MSNSVFFLLSTNKLYKKENTRRRNNFAAGYLGNFYRNLADNIDSFTDCYFYSRIAADTNIPKQDVQKNIMVTSDFAKSIQTDKPLCYSRQNKQCQFQTEFRSNQQEYLEEAKSSRDISTFDAENLIVDSLLRETDIKKKTIRQ